MALVRRSGGWYRRCKVIPCCSIDVRLNQKTHRFTHVEVYNLGANAEKIVNSRPCLQCPYTESQYPLLYPLSPNTLLSQPGSPSH